MFHENKARHIFRKTNIFYSLICTRCTSEDKKCSFFGKFDVLCFLETPVLRFALLPYYQRLDKWFLWAQNHNSIKNQGLNLNNLFFLRQKLFRKKNSNAKNQSRRNIFYFHAWCSKMAKHTLKILRCEYRQFFRVCFAIFQHFACKE